MSREQVAPQTVRDLRRGQIILAARALVAQQGLAALTFAALESRLAFTRGVITYHFRNKDELVRAVLDEVLADIESTAVRAVRGQPYAEAVAGVLSAMLHGFEAHPDASQLLLTTCDRAGADAALYEAQAALFERWRAFCAELVRRHQVAGAVRLDVHPPAIGALMVGAVAGLSVQSRFAGTDLDPAREIQLAAEAIVLRTARQP